MFIIGLGWLMLIGGMFEIGNWFEYPNRKLTKIKVFGTLVFVALLSASHKPSDWFELPVLIIISAFCVSVIEFILRKAEHYASVHQK